jgi:hypothetical protein
LADDTVTSELIGIDASTLRIPNFDVWALPRLPSQAESILESLTRQIVDFEKAIDESQEVGFRLVGAPDQSTIHIERIECEGAAVLVFFGRNLDGREVRVLQHASQVSVLLTALPKIAEKARRMGF